MGNNRIIDNTCTGTLHLLMLLRPPTHFDDLSAVLGVGHANTFTHFQPVSTETIKTLMHLFQGGAAPACLMQADATADDMIDITDPIFTLTFLFLGLPPGLFLAEGCGHAFGTLGCATPSCTTPDSSLTGTEAGNQSETAVAINPTDSNNIVIVSNRWVQSGLFRFFTTNGGTSWNAHNPNDKLILTSHAGIAFDPALAFDKFGNLFLAYQNTGLWIAVSVDKGQTFTRMSSSLTLGADRSAIAAGPHPTIPANSTVWACTRTVPSISAFVATITGVLPPGAVPQFSAPIEVTTCSTSPPTPDTNRDCDVNYADMAVGPNGEVAVAYNNGAHLGAHTRPVMVFVKMRRPVAPPGPGQQDNQGFELKFATPSNVAALAHADLPFDFIPARPNAAKGIVAAPDLAWDRSREQRLFMIFTNKDVLSGAFNPGDDVLVARVGVDCGGAGVPGLFESDLGNPTGQSVSITTVLDTTGLTDPAPAEVYTTARRSTNGASHSYSIASALNGRYRIRVHFAHVTTLGNPVFNFLAEGEVIGLLDGFADAAGVNRVAIRELEASVTDGNGIQLTCTPVQPTGQAYELAIEVIGENLDSDVFIVSSTPTADPNTTYGTWSTPIRVNDDPALPRNSQFFPKVAVDQDTGIVGACWYDTRAPEGGFQDLRRVRLYARYSTDGGLSFTTPAFPVSCEQSNGAAAPVGQSTLGDYIGLDFFKKAMFPAWGDNSTTINEPNPNTEVHTKRVLVP